MKFSRAEKRGKLVQKVRLVAQEIGFPERANITALAIVLDKRGIKPLQSDHWIDPLGVCYPLKLKQFLAWHLPELLDGKPLSRPVSRVPDLLAPISMRPMGQLDGDVTQPVTHPVTQPEAQNYDGWTLHQDKRGFWRAHKRINGTVRTIYIGRDPSRAAEKIRAHGGRYEQA